MEYKCNETGKSAMTLYCLNQNPPYLLHVVGDVTYKVTLDGRTEIAGSIPLPLPGTPFPELLAKAKLLYFVISNSKGIIIAALLAAVLILSNIAFIYMGGAEAVAMAQTQFSIIMNSTLALLFCLPFIVYAVRQFKKGIVLEFGGDKTMLLESGEISFGTDVSVLSSSENEAPEEYIARVESAQKALKPGQWLIVIPFRANSAMIQTSGAGEEMEGYTMLRSMPIMEGDAGITIDAIQASTNTYKNETWAQYMSYCKEFANRYTVWAQAARLNSPGGNPIETIVRSAACVLLILVLPMSGFSQKSVQVNRYLGDVRYTMDVPEKGADVSFVFQRAALQRTGDGQKTYKELLKASPVFTDADDQGKLIGITLNGKVVLPEGKKEAAAPEEKESSEVKSMGVIQRGNWYDALPDSNQLEQMKAEHIRQQASEWKKIEPLLNYYRWRFWGIMSLLIGLGAMLWVFAKVSATDSVKSIYGYAFIGNAITGIHIVSKTALFLILSVPTLIIMTFDAIECYYTQEFTLFLAIKYAFIALVWYLVFEKVLPDSPQIGRGTGGNGNYPGQRVLGS